MKGHDCENKLSLKYFVFKDTVILRSLMFLLTVLGRGSGGPIKGLP